MDSTTHVTVKWAATRTNFLLACCCGLYHSRDCEVGLRRSRDCEAGLRRSRDCEAGLRRSRNSEAVLCRSRECETGLCRSRECETGLCRSRECETGLCRSRDCEAGRKRHKAPPRAFALPFTVVGWIVLVGSELLALGAAADAVWVGCRGDTVHRTLLTHMV